MSNFYTDVICKDSRFKYPLRVKDVMLLEPVMRSAVMGIIADAAALGIVLMVFETYRSQARQAALFAQGATRLKTVGVHHYGLACDLVKDVDGEPSWKGDFTFLVPLAKKCGLISGIDWGRPDVPHSFVDGCHVQRIALEEQMRLFTGMWYPDAEYAPRREVTRTVEV